MPAYVLAITLDAGVINIESETASELMEFTVDCKQASKQTGSVATKVIEM